MLVHYLVHQTLIYYCVLTIIKNNIHYKLKINDNKKQPLVALEHWPRCSEPVPARPWRTAVRLGLAQREEPHAPGLMLWQTAVKFIPSLPLTPKSTLSCYMPLPKARWDTIPSSVL